jgi:hypothetical protein
MHSKDLVERSEAKRQLTRHRLRGEEMLGRIFRNMMESYGLD